MKQHGARIKRINQIIRKIEILQGEFCTMHLDHAIENLRLAAIVCKKESEAWERYRADLEREKKVTP